MRTIMLGMGNPVLSDDAVGIRLVKDFNLRIGKIQDLDVMEECCVGGLNLLHIIEGYDRLIVIDAIKTKDGVPGMWYHFTGDKLRETMNLTNVHDANFATTLELGRRIGMKIPPDNENYIFAVEIADNLTFNDKMTDELATAYPIYSEEIFEALRNLIFSDKNAERSLMNMAREIKNKAQKLFFKCDNCNNVFEAKEPPETCPNCMKKCTFRDVSCYTPDCDCEGPDPKLL